jgi:hypothetical protein
LRNKSDGCGASVTSAAGPLTARKKQYQLILFWLFFITSLLSSSRTESFCDVLVSNTADCLRYSFTNFYLRSCVYQ